MFRVVLGEEPHHNPRKSLDHFEGIGTRIENEQLACTKSCMTTDLQTQANYWPTIHVAGLYFMHNSFGMTLMCNDLLMFPFQRALPLISTRFELVSEMESDTISVVPDDEPDILSQTNFPSTV